MYSEFIRQKPHETSITCPASPMPNDPGMSES
jgi:hypothetical protein